MFLTGERVSAAGALQCNLIQEMVPEPRTFSGQWASELLTHSAEVLKKQKMILRAFDENYSRANERRVHAELYAKRNRTN